MTNPNRALPGAAPTTTEHSSLQGHAKAGYWIIALAAAGVGGWSLHTVALHYGVPWLFALVVSAVFDGAGMVCLYLASAAVTENRSAFAPMLATIGLGALSIYLNRVHALLAGGGMGATIMFATPALALQLVTYLSWAATRERHRLARGERRMRLPVFGPLAWLLARKQAWTATQKRAVEHVRQESAEASAAPTPDQSETEATLALSGMTPTEAIRILHKAYPDLTNAQLAAILNQYGQRVSEFDVAIVLARAAHQDEEQDERWQTSTEQEVLIDRIIRELVAGPGLTTAAAVRAVRAAIPELAPGQIAEELTRRGIETTDHYVRTVNSRARKTKSTQPKNSPSAPKPVATPGYL
ncbi:DUF2637 domain-containing protein [Streptomyces sp. NPDC049577]|uniref:DUF2637 domain-containing protein n=1 Tax=Streptomyces sp. NPDC049577 TaxID=3155153 RepID=UPI003438FDF7